MRIFTVLLLILVFVRASMAAPVSPLLITTEGADSLEAIQKEGLMSGSARIEPWRGYFYPMFYGGIAARLMDPAFPKSEHIKINHNYVETNNAEVIFSTSEGDLISKLSPAEKYDLLVGDKNFTLTKYSWFQGLRRVDEFRDKKLPGWYGYCDGLTGASTLFSHPQKAITIVSADGKTPIKFYPDDIKALLTLQMALSDEKRIIEGGRCVERVLKKDESGRVESDVCRDVDPGLFHVIVTNRVGKHKELLYFDRNFDYEEWNFPIMNYSYQYFNLDTLANSSDSESSLLKLEDYSWDKFKASRDPRTVYIIGIKMTVDVPNVILPAAKEWDTLSDDDQENKTLKYTYFYDLELDKDKKIIKGEWHTQNFHPDFLWAYVDAHGYSDFDEQATLRDEKWDTKSVLPESWQQAAKKSSVGGRPLQIILDKLIELSNSKSLFD